MSSCILCIIVEKSDVTLNCICGHRMEQMSDFDLLNVCVSGEGVGDWSGVCVYRQG